MDNPNSSNNQRPNCYKCIYRRNIGGDAHSSCSHPKTGGSDNSFEALMSFYVGLGGPAKELNITADEHGITSEWFAWPLNFDPIWLRTCDGYTEKDNKD